MFIRAFGFSLRLFSVCGLLFSAYGCSTVEPTPPRAPEQIEERLFKDVSAFYCSQQRWPASWGEFVQLQESAAPGASGYLVKFSDAELDSPRAILLTVRYKNEEGNQRKVTFIAPPDCNGGRSSDTVSIAGGRVTFYLPEGFQVLDGKAIKAKWKDGPYPDVAWQNLKTDVFVTVNFGEVSVEPAEMEAFKVELEEAYESLPGITWIEKRLEDVDGSPELVHEFMSDNPSGSVVSYNIARSFDGRHLAISIAGAGDKIKAVESTASVIRGSLRVR
jgi:hypothetical protein